MTLLETRKQYKVSQVEVASFLDVPVRTYIRYEQDDNYGNKLKREMMINEINKKYEITEDKGILSIDMIKEKITDLFDKEYKGQIDFCYLFGSYSKGLATEKSDVDLYVSSSLSGLRFVGLIERIRQTLHKKIDLIRSSELNNNVELVNEIMKSGVKIYG